MIEITTFATHEPIFNPRYFVGSVFDPFPLNNASNRPWPQQVGTECVFQISSVKDLKMLTNESQFAAAFKNSGGTSFELLLLCNFNKVLRISSAHGAVELMSICLVIFWSSVMNDGGSVSSGGASVGAGGLKWDLKWSHNFAGSHAVERIGL